MGEDRRVNRNSSVIINSADNLKTQARKAGGRAAEKRGEREPSLVGGDKLASLGRPVRRRAGGNNQNEEGGREEGGMKILQMKRGLKEKTYQEVGSCFPAGNHLY